VPSIGSVVCENEEGGVSRVGTEGWLPVVEAAAFEAARLDERACFESLGRSERGSGSNTRDGNAVSITAGVECEDPDSDIVSSPRAGREGDGGAEEADAASCAGVAVGSPPTASGTIRLDWHRGQVTAEPDRDRETLSRR
jgi:hypothetical protein